ncbi:MAG: phosphate signaling complex protein PhoU, partial [Clostridia bacterium]|nr:phosphate signaling complex protein PhoU [Clostridia bacterium]
MSIRKIFEDELAELKTQLVEMCRLTEQMISDAITALVNKDRELGKSIGVMDKRVDEYEMAIEKRCMRILLRQQPVAKDFREVSTALKMITDIERFGDQATDIGDLVYTMPGDTYIKKLTHITAMGNLAVKMVRESVNSFINNDERLADEVISLDDQMDELFDTVKAEL